MIATNHGVLAGSINLHIAFDINLGHRVQADHCQWLHGHQYKIEFVLEGLDQDIDTSRGNLRSELCEALGDWLSDHWEEAFLFHAGDDVARAAAACIPGQKVYPMPYAPTPENIARHLLEDVCPKILVDLDVRATHVAVEENESIAAVASVFG